MDTNKIQRRYRRLVFWTWFLTLDLIMFGAFVRLTDSGLGCPDWPGCYGNLSPIGASAHISDALLSMPYGPVSFPKAWIEMIHRYIGSLLGLLIIGITWMAWRWRHVLQRRPTLATVTLVTVCLQGAFGAWTVTHKLMPIIVTTHLLGGMTVLGLMTWLAAREKYHPPLAKPYRPLIPWVSLGLVLLGGQIALEGWVSTNYAAIACMDFPTCHGQWLPPMDFSGGFSLVRALSVLPPASMCSVDALYAIHWTHRNFAFLVFIYLLSLAVRTKNQGGLVGPTKLMIGLLIAQLITGLTTIFFQWPLAIAVIHNGGAAGLVLVMVTMLVRLSGQSRARNVS